MTNPHTTFVTGTDGIRREYVEFTVPNTNPNVKGDQRLLIITHGSVVTGLTVTALANDGTGGTIVLSDVVVPTETFRENLHLFTGLAQMAGVE